jgi:hypothetical protein
MKRAGLGYESTDETLGGSPALIVVSANGAKLLRAACRHPSTSMAPSDRPAR